VTVLEVIQRSTAYLTRKAIESPRLQVELLLAQLLKLPRLQLYLNFQRELTEGELDALRGWVQRRGEHEPLQQITGTTSFCGLEIRVNRDVLVPRPETETLAERGWKHLSARPSASPTALDFGTGSGCLAIALAFHCPAARLTAIDVSPAALDVARANAGRHGLAARIEFRLGDGFAALPQDARFDLMVANPPYIRSAEIETLQPEVRDFDPRLALDGGADGLDFYRRLAAEATPFLSADGALMTEFGDGQEADLPVLFAAAGWREIAVETDLSGRPRIVIARPGGA